ncbi:MAG: ribosomal L7Ae/L30e/S12e/Gadd45 family protein [Oscillospiraceae bacterium]|nr:ribosomal L7Ae/L30e/S12e/Gadd45 family protein [Oscillospiraceae bacterium]
MEKVLSMIGLALKAGRVEIGEEPVGAAARAKKARVILVASDAAPASARRAASFAQSGACILLTVPASKESLGRALGRTSVAMAAVTDIGLAGSIVQKLASLDPNAYGPAAEQLALKARRAQQRREEQRRHEKNARRGKKK